VRLVSWNVNRRVKLLAQQAHALAERGPDVVALQEITARTWPLWETALRTIGLPHARCSWPPRPRRTVVLIATREPHEPAEPLNVPWPETTLAARVEGVIVHCAHVPNAANGWVKPDTLAALRAGLASTSGPRVLCGDLNTPRREKPDGTVISFARDTHERLREERGIRWDDAELGVVPGLRDLGFSDAFRAVHGYARKEPSWVFPHGGGWRLDHVFVSAELEPVAATYHHAWRDGGLSDHSALEVELESVSG
jgi:exonuclease III